MIKLDTIRDNLNCGEYGGELVDYMPSGNYVCDAVSEIADGNTSIYYYDIEKFISDHVDDVNDAINEFGWPGDLYKAGQLAEYQVIEQDIYENLADALTLCIVDYMENTLDIQEVPDSFSDDLPDLENVDRFDELKEWADAYAGPWHCPNEDCDGAELEADLPRFTCPVCGCSTASPAADACWLDWPGASSPQ